MSQQYQVIIYDNEAKMPIWRPVVFEVVETVSKDIYRAGLGANMFQPTIRYVTTDLREASAKLKEMLTKGWKSKIKMVNK